MNIFFKALGVFFTVTLCSVSFAFAQNISNGNTTKTITKNTNHSKTLPKKSKLTNDQIKKIQKLRNKYIKTTPNANLKLIKDPLSKETIKSLPKEKHKVLNKNKKR